VFRLLRAINPLPREIALAPLAGAHFLRLVEQPLQKVLESIDDQGLAKEVSAALFERLRDIPVRFGLVHGDFSVYNIFALDGRVNGLIDWEDVNPSGLPILDALNYLESVHRAFNPELTLVDTIPLLASGDWPVEEERRFLAESYEYLGFDAKHHRGFTVLYWLHHVRPQLEFSLACNRGGIRQSIDLVARELLLLQ
jgi:aminoglycoside phosphotransferase (APT) family kinase protein